MKYFFIDNKGKTIPLTIKKQTKEKMVFEEELDVIFSIKSNIWVADLIDEIGNSGSWVSNCLEHICLNYDNVYGDGKWERLPITSSDLKKLLDYINDIREEELKSEDNKFDPYYKKNPFTKRDLHL